MTGRPATAQPREVARLRRVRDRIDREYAQPLNVEALARGVHMSAGHLSRQFMLAYGKSPYSYLMTRRTERAMALLQQGEVDLPIHPVGLPHRLVPLTHVEGKTCEDPLVKPGLYEGTLAAQRWPCQLTLVCS